MKIIHIMKQQNIVIRIVIKAVKLYQIQHKIVNVSVSQKSLFKIKNVHKVVNKDTIIKMVAK